MTFSLTPEMDLHDTRDGLRRTSRRSQDNNKSSNKKKFVVVSWQRVDKRACVQMKRHRIGLDLFMTSILICSRTLVVTLVAQLARSSAPHPIALVRQRSRIRPDAPSDGHLMQSNGTV